jgi:hypothetical protein
MKLTAYPKTIFCLALLLGWGNCMPPATAQSSEDCLIYTTIGTDVHATWEAQGRLAVIR